MCVCVYVRQAGGRVLVRVRVPTLCVHRVRVCVRVRVGVRGVLGGELGSVM